MAVVLDRTQRDALYQFVVADLPDMGDITRELHRGDLAAAQRLRCRFDEDVLVLDLLDWGELGERDEYRITLPPEQTVAIFTRLYGYVVGGIVEALSTLLEYPVAPALEAARTCATVIGSLQPAEVRRRPECG